MKTSNLEPLIAKLDFFQGMDDEHRSLVAGCAKNLVVKKGEFLAREGQPAEAFFVVREGTVAIEIFSPAKGGIVISTLRDGEVFGWSWLFPPYRSNFDARAATDVFLLSFDGKCLREKCERDPAFGYDVMKRFSKVMTGRLHATRMQLLDLYGNRANDESSKG